jgi:hypothetical protein
MITADFDAPYRSCPRETVNPSTDAKFTTAVPVFMYGTHAAVTFKTPSTLTSKMKRKFSSVYVSKVVGGNTPAILATASM